MLFFCAWPEDASFLVDAVDEAAARAAARETNGSEPATVRAIPVGTFACSVHWEDDDEDDDSEVLILDALPHVVDLLGELEDEEPCGAEAEGDGGAIVRCELAAGHPSTVKHRAGDLVW